MAKFAENTDVPVERSQAEIQRTIQRYGATSYMAGYQGSMAAVMFECEGKRIRFNLPLPDRTAHEFASKRVNQNSPWTPRPPGEANARWEQACRQRWRALLLLIKAKLEAVEAGITSFEEEMLAHIVMPDGMTVSEKVLPGLQAAIENGAKLPPLLGTGKGTAK
jgi:hypothetical protein